MGKFTYDTVRVEIEDRVLAHVQHVIASKLRRGECFMFTWKLDVSTGGGRQSVWMHPAATLTFKFHGGREPALNRDWLHALAQVAASPSGLYVVPEPQRPISEPLEREAMRFHEVHAGL